MNIAEHPLKNGTSSYMNGYLFIRCSSPLDAPYAVDALHPLHALYPLDALHHSDALHLLDALHPFDCIHPLDDLNLFMQYIL